MKFWNRPSVLKTATLTYVLGLVLIDLILKKDMAARLAGGRRITVIDGILSLRYVENHGAAFSILEGHSYLFIIFAVVFLIALGIWFYRAPYQKNIAAILSLIAAGAIGNLYDRIVFGYVRDFFEFDFMNFPVFNVADIYITLAAVWIIIYLLFDSEKGGKDKNVHPDSPGDSRDDASEGTGGERQ